MNNLDEERTIDTLLQHKVREQHVLFCAKHIKQLEELKLHINEPLVEKTFKVGIEYGNLPLIKYLITDDKYKNKLINSTENFNKEVQEASKLNHVDVIKYLIEESPIKNKINIHDDCERAFSLAHKNAAKDVLKYFIFDLNFEKNNHIKYALKQKSECETNNFFEIRKVATELKNDLNESNLEKNNKKIKI